MRTIIMLTLAAALISGSASAQDAASGLAGDWAGTLHTGAAELRLVVHFTRAADGWAGAMDSIDQGANGIAITDITLAGPKLKFSAPSIGGSYEGTLQPGGNAVKGSWTQGQPFSLDLTRGPATAKASSKAAKPTDIDGDWGGTIAAALRVIFHVVNTEDGLTATMDSLDQGMKGMPATAVSRAANVFTAEWKSIGGKFEGTLDVSLKTMDGQWSQGGTTMPLVLKRGVTPDKAEQRRPQNPVKPYPYREEEVTFQNKAAGITLAGTITIPPGKGPFPAVFLITGSGPQDRDEALLGHRPFLVLADYLTRKGIAVLRADDRGIGKSGGIFAKATTVDFADDAEAAVGYLQTRSEVDKAHIGLIGHSEGGVIAPMVAVRNPGVGFIILMAGTGVTGEQVLVAQVRALAVASGTSPAEAEKQAEMQSQILEVVKRTQDASQLRDQLKTLLAGTPQAANVDVFIKTLDSAWFRYFMTYDPAKALRKVKCPVLAINGEKDAQVPPKQNLPAIRKALEAGGNQDFEVVELPGLNHLFQTAKTGGFAEYAQIEETIAPTALEKMSTWILAHARP